MKFIIINADYTKFIDDLYRQNDGLINKSYNEQLKFRYGTLFGIADFYSKNLIKLGHEAIDIFPNNVYLQKQWARENNIKYSNDYFLEKFPKIYRFIKPNWYYKILLNQIKLYNPDIIYNLGMESISNSFLEKIKKENKKIKIIGQHAAVITSGMKKLDSYDLILSSLPNQVEYFRSIGVKSCYFKLGFEKSILDIIEKKEPIYDIVHIGGYGRIHNTRNSLLEKVAEKIDNIKFWGFGLKNLQDNSLIVKKMQGEAWGHKMYDILSRSKITITMHIKSVAGNYANNMSLYESTGMGVLLMVDNKENLHEIFEVGKEVVAYDSADDLVEKIEYYLSNEEERKAIAAAGQKRTLKEHTYEKRMIELIDIINNNIIF